MQVRKSLCLVSFLIGFTTLLQAQKMTPQQYIATYKNLAIEEMRRSGVPAAIKLAQGIVETQSGNGELCLQSNNHFGIKCKNTWTGKTIKYDDDASQECFRVYESARDSYVDHSNFLHNNPRYAFLFQFDGDDYKSWAFGLKQAGYATNNTYPQQLIKVIEDYNLQQYTLIAMGKATAVPESVDEKAGSRSYANMPRKQDAPSPALKGSNNYTAPVKKNYPEGIFEINGSRAVYVKAGTSLIQLADQHNIRLRKLLRYNDLESDYPPAEDMILFLQKKSKRGYKDVHDVTKGESMYSIAQAEGIQLRWLRRRNKMQEGEEPEVGQRLMLNGYASSAPSLARNSMLLKKDIQEPSKDFSPREVITDIKEKISKNLPAPMATPGTVSLPRQEIGTAAIQDKEQVTEVTIATAAPRASMSSAFPAASAYYHQVQPKETLYGIAKMYSKSVTQLQEWNNLEGVDIKIGQRLLVNK